MASKKEYYKEYSKQKKKADSLGKNIKALTKIKNSLTNDFYDEQGNVNKEIDDLMEDLKQSVRHDSKFTTLASNHHSYKEKSSTADSNLCYVIDSIEDEIASLEKQKEKAEEERDTNWDLYKAAK